MKPGGLHRRSSPPGLTRCPDWVPEGSENDPRFACRVKSGVPPGSADASRTPAKRRKLTLDDYEHGVLALGHRHSLSRAITLVESNHPAHEALAQELLGPRPAENRKLHPRRHHRRPRCGKSTLIESLGCQLCEQGHRVAVLAVDPSSSVTGGSILGDKTRMQNLVRQANAYIRPSPSAGSLRRRRP